MKIITRRGTDDFYTALPPHPPLNIPAGGVQESVGVESTVQGMKDLAKELGCCRTWTLVVITPHGKYLQIG
jgi:hypothetical protein